jgi:radical SAM superfamily enzyme YgiQ (UPF0313 family)
VDANTARDYTIDGGPMGPIGEAESLILRATRNCPWNRCLFCGVYKGKKFQFRSASEIKNDIDVVRRITDLVEEASWDIGLGGRIMGELFPKIVRAHPHIYGEESHGLTVENYAARRSLGNVMNWLMCGRRRVFLQDANSLIMNPGELAEVLTYLKEAFPTIRTITSYARSKTCAQRSAQEFEKLRDAGLSWLFVGIESGANDVLKSMRKGVTAEEHIDGGRKVMGSGIHLAAFVMPGLAGNNGQLSQEHVTQTTRVLNEIMPTEVRVRSLAVLEGTPLYTRWRSGDFNPPSEDQMIEEIGFMVRNIEFDCTFETYQMTNVLFNIKENLNEKRDELISRIKAYQDLPVWERARFRFHRYLYHGYVDYLERIGRCDASLHRLIEETKKSLERKDPEAIGKVEQAIFAIKSKGIP